MQHLQRQPRSRLHKTAAIAYINCLHSASQGKRKGQIRPVSPYSWKTQECHYTALFLIFFLCPFRLWEVQLNASRPYPVFLGEGGHAGRQSYCRWAEGLWHDGRRCRGVRKKASQSSDLALCDPFLSLSFSTLYSQHAVVRISDKSEYFRLMFSSYWNVYLQYKVHFTTRGKRRKNNLVRID